MCVHFVSVIGIPYYGRTTERFLDFGFVVSWILRKIFGKDASCGIQIDGFSARSERLGSIFNNFSDCGVFFFCVFAYVFGFLALPPGGLMTACECPKPARSGLPSTAASKESNALILFKGAPPIAADPGRFPDFRIFALFGTCRFFGISR